MRTLQTSDICLFVSFCLFFGERGKCSVDELKKKKIVLTFRRFFTCLLVFVTDSCTGKMQGI